jgi:hypothetical protein
MSLVVDDEEVTHDLARDRLEGNGITGSLKEPRASVGTDQDREVRSTLGFLADRLEVAVIEHLTPIGVSSAGLARSPGSRRSSARSRPFETSALRRQTAPLQSSRSWSWKQWL